jgi:excisionase family DNA binding protein
MSTNTLDRLPRVLTVPEYAAEMRLSERHVYEMCRDGRLKDAIRQGRRWIIPRRVLEELLGERSPAEVARA